MTSRPEREPPEKPARKGKAYESRRKTRRKPFFRISRLLREGRAWPNGRQGKRVPQPTDRGACPEEDNRAAKFLIVDPIPKSIEHGLFAEGRDRAAAAFLS